MMIQLKDVATDDIFKILCLKHLLWNTPTAADPVIQEAIVVNQSEPKFGSLFLLYMKIVLYLTYIPPSRYDCSLLFKVFFKGLST